MVERISGAVSVRKQVVDIGKTPKQGQCDELILIGHDVCSNEIQLDATLTLIRPVVIELSLLI
jgi:hypothetical protein